jgi:predicted secreted hydrolase
VTGWLEDAGATSGSGGGDGEASAGTGRPLGFQVTFFRVRPGVDESNPSRFTPRQVLFAHAAIADPSYGRLRHAQRSAREGFELAYARTGSTDVRIDDWQLVRSNEAAYRAQVRDEAFALELALGPTQPPLLQGDRGFSRKSPAEGAASYYYSVPQLEVHGRVVIDGRSREVRGVAWLDHEWSSRVLDERARGWDWVGINFADGAALMAFEMRAKSGGRLWAAATWRSKDGRVEVLPQSDIDWQPLASWQSPRTSARYPVRWRLRAGTHELELVPLLEDAELDSRASTGAIYWEGPVSAVSPSQAELGRGYLELTGYAEPIRF